MKSASKSTFKIRNSVITFSSRPANACWRTFRGWKESLHKKKPCGGLQPRATQLNPWLLIAPHIHVSTQCGSCKATFRFGSTGSRRLVPRSRHRSPPRTRHFRSVRITDSCQQQRSSPIDNLLTEREQACELELVAVCLGRQQSGTKGIRSIDLAWFIPVLRLKAKGL